MNIVLGLATFVIGLFFGSFGNVVSLRLQSHKKGVLWGRSQCPQCDHQLAWWENIPLFSWLLLRGKCAHCSKGVSWQYPLVELFFGVLFALVGFVTPIDAPFLLLWRLVIVFALGIIVLSDLRYMDIPDQVSLPLIRFLVVVSLISTFVFPLSQKIPSIAPALFGAAILYGFFALQVVIPGVLNSFSQKSFLPLKNAILALIVLFVWLISSVFFLHKKLEAFLANDQDGKEEDDPGWIGGGDFRIAVIMGLALGPLIGIFAVLIGYAVGAFLSLPLLLFTKKTGKSMIPLGPFLAIGMVIMLLWGHKIVALYLRIIGF